MADRTLEIISQYKMTEMEAKAFKIACMYLEKAPKFFPNYNHYRLPKGDPRKSDLFKQCHKLLRQKQDKIANEDYDLYVHAQLDVLRNIRKGDLHPCITPSCLAGDQAWKRWLLWKGRHDKRIESKNIIKVSPTNVHDTEKIKKSLWKTKQFFLAWFDRLESADILESLKDLNIFRWYQTGNVCGYYFLLSPLVTNWLKENPLDLTQFSLNFKTYEHSFHQDVENYFKTEFSYEIPSTSK